jgi:UDP-2,3-diacylglucosamine hydrolase
LTLARDARDASALHKGKAGMEIMDVNTGEVAAAFERHGVQRMIHGHTHRPAIHDLVINGQRAQRIVLGDWYTRGSVLRVTPDGYDLATI